LIGAILLFLDYWQYYRSHKASLERRRRYGARRKECKRAEWQHYNFPTCNSIHEIELGETYQRGKLQSEEEAEIQGKIGYLAQGYWRSVFAVDPGGKERSVLKMMRTTHDLIPENYEIHREDMLVMERLTSSPNVVDMFGFCGNSVVTEFITMPLDKLIAQREPESLGVKLLSTKEGKLRMALDVAKGVAALHEIEGGPIIHVDLQPRQFLVTHTGQVKINDFNRCRFMGYFEATGDKCDFYLQGAPGTSRSPEEYSKSEQDEKLDIFSMANVFYAILVGRKVWTVRFIDDW
jgi:serine/threonine protein kinase